MRVTRDDFERLPADHAFGSKIYGRPDLLDDPDPCRGLSPGDFLGRLVTLFGPPDPDGGFVLRHRATGVELTAYSAQSGPAYGGDVVHDVDPRALSAAAAACDAAEKTAAPRDVRLARLRLRDLFAPPGYADVVRALEALLAETPLTDFEIADHERDDGPWRVGVRGGVPFEERVKRG